MRNVLAMLSAFAVVCCGRVVEPDTFTPTDAPNGAAVVVVERRVRVDASADAVDPTCPIGADECLIEDASTPPDDGAAE